MPYKALTYVFVGGVKYAPGDSINKSEFGDHTEEQIEELVKGGAISEDMDAPLHPDHQVADELQAPEGSDRHVVASDDGNGGDGA